MGVGFNKSFERSFSSAYSSSRKIKALKEEQRLEDERERAKEEREQERIRRIAEKIGRTYKDDIKDPDAYTAFVESLGEAKDVKEMQSIKESYLDDVQQQRDKKIFQIRNLAEKKNRSKEEGIKLAALMNEVGVENIDDPLYNASYEAAIARSAVPDKEDIRSFTALSQATRRKAQTKLEGLKQEQSVNEFKKEYELKNRQLQAEIQQNQKELELEYSKLKQRKYETEQDRIDNIRDYQLKRERLKQNYIDQYMDLQKSGAAAVQPGFFGGRNQEEISRKQVAVKNAAEGYARTMMGELDNNGNPVPTDDFGEPMPTKVKPKESQGYILTESDVNKLNALAEQFPNSSDEELLNMLFNGQ